MNKIIQKTVVGGLASLILGSGLAFGDDTKKPEVAPKDVPLSEGAKAEILDHLKKLNLDKDTQKQIAEALKTAKNAKVRSKVKTFVVGPDGKMVEVESKDDVMPDISGLLKGKSKEEIQKLLKNAGVAVTGKLVVIDENGKTVKKELKPGKDLNKLIQAALKGKNLGGVDLSELLGNARVLGVGRPSVLDTKEEVKEVKEIRALKNELAELVKQMKKQQELLKKQQELLEKDQELLEKQLKKNN